MAATSTGRQLLDALAARVSALEGMQGNPIERAEDTAQDLMTRLSALEADYMDLKKRVERHLSKNRDHD